MLLCSFNHFLYTFSILSRNQYALREKISTLHEHFQLVTKVSMAVDNNDKLKIPFFLDLHKGFDSVDHNILPDKLVMFGIKLKNLRMVHKIFK